MSDHADTSGKPAVGISSCLLGEKVRYDGQHKLDHYLKDTLGPFVRWVPVCPEVEMGLSIPREAMRLVGRPEAPRLLTRKSRVDHTDGMMKWAGGRIGRLAGEDLCGFVFKSRSPSSGTKNVKVYSADGIHAGTSAGLFAGAFIKRFPLLPVEEDDRLHDPGLRENFVGRIFVFRRWLDYIAGGGTRKGLADFHARHKYIVMAHSSGQLKKLDDLAARAADFKPAELKERYLEELMKGLCLKTTVRKNGKVLLHILGRLKTRLTSDEKAAVLEAVGEYENGVVPLIVPVILLRHFARRCDEPCLGAQHYLYPHPAELRLGRYT